jgi:hypothetical protein
MEQQTYEMKYRREILKQLKGLKYWLYLFGL